MINEEVKTAWLQEGGEGYAPDPSSELRTAADGYQDCSFYYYAFSGIVISVT